jgi:putative salt-induced outer membrane protein
MIRLSVRTLSLALVLSAPLLAQEPAKKPPYEFVGDFNLAASQGNQEVNTVSLGQRYSYQFADWKFSQTASALRGSANGVKNAELYQGGMRGDYNLTKKLSAYVSTNGLRNTPAGLTSQFNEGVGLAYQFTDTDIDKLQFSAGVGALQRKFAGVSASQNDLVGQLDGLYRHLFSKVSYFEQTAGLVPNFSTSDAWLFSSKSSVVAPLSARFGIKVAYLINYNNAPPFTLAAGRPTTTRFKKFDGLLTTGVQFTY